MYTLYGGRYTRAIVVEMVMEEGDIPYELRSIDIVNQEHRTEPYLSINPTGLIPALITPEGETLYETHAICLYLADRYQLTQLVPATDDPLRGRFLSGLFNLSGEFEPVMKRYDYPHRYILRREDNDQMRDLALSTVLDQLEVMNRNRVLEGPYFLGERFSLVDVVLAFWTTGLQPEEVMKPYNAIRRANGLVADRPALREQFSRMADWQQEYAELQQQGDGVS